MPKPKEKKCPNCGGKVVARPGIDGMQYYCTQCRRRVWDDDWKMPDFVEIGRPRKNVRKTKGYFGDY